MWCGNVRTVQTSRHWKLFLGRYGLKQLLCLIHCPTVRILQNVSAFYSACFLDSVLYVLVFWRRKMFGAGLCVVGSQRQNKFPQKHIGSQGKMLNLCGTHWIDAKFVETFCISSSPIFKNYFALSLGNPFNKQSSFSFSWIYLVIEGLMITYEPYLHISAPVVDTFIRCKFFSRRSCSTTLRA